VVMEAGKIVEQGSPASLLANQNSRSVKSANEKQGGLDLVLKAGTIVVQGSPASLLANQNSRSVKSANEKHRG
jgi:ABC-type multidrug transport system fused ATPase/permease subunit